MKPDLYQHFSRIGKALSSPARLEILDLLAQGEKSVELLAGQTRLTVKNASSHLRELRSARLVETRKEGTHVFYRLAEEAVFDLLRTMQRLGESRLAEVDRITRLYLERRDQLEPISAAELLRRVEAGGVLVLDVRPADEYRSGHVPGAVSMPIEELEHRLCDLPRDREVIAYCRGPYCVYAAEAVEALQGAGIAARRMEEGLPDWRALGFPVAEGDDPNPPRPEELP